MNPRSSTVLVCFAVKEEARPFCQTSAPTQLIRTLVTGMGPQNATLAIRQAVQESRPQLVLTCGFAGGLKPGIPSGTVLCSCDPTEVHFLKILTDAGAQPAVFACSSRVIVTRAEKQSLHEQSGADAVEMESQPIRSFCLQQDIPSATVRVILDAADEDLPLDFNQFLTADARMNHLALAVHLVKHPNAIPALLRFRRQTSTAARKLSEVLSAALRNQLR